MLVRSTLRANPHARMALLGVLSLVFLATLLVSSIVGGTGTATYAAPEAAQAVESGGGGHTWEHQSPLPSSATMNDVDMISATEGWAAGQYVGNGGTIVHTTDGGLTWEYSTTDVEEPNYSVRFLDQNHGWVSSNNAVFYTTDGGRTWGEGQGLIGSFYFMDFATVNDGFATTGIDQGYFRTTDGGQTWTRKPLPRDVAGIQFFDANNGVANSEDGVFHTTDRGTTWSFTPGEGGTNFLNHNLGWSVVGNISKRTTDGGATWQQGSMPAGAWAYDAMFLDEQNGWASGAGFQVLRTTDSGMTWNFSRLPNTYPYMLYDSWGIDFGDASHGVAVGGFEGGAMRGGGVILTTLDTGGTWVPGHNGSATTTFRIFALDENHAWAANDYAEVLWTTNGGARWNLSSVIQGGEMRDVEFADPLNGWVVGDFGFVYRSTDGGRNWLQQYPNTLGQKMFGVAVIDSQTAVVVGGGEFGPVTERTTDGGQSWTSIDANNGTVLLDVYFLNQTTGWIVGNNGKISKSTDGGQTWTPQTSPVVSDLNNISFADENNGWAGGGFGTALLHTTNSGQTWVQQDPGLPSYASVLGVSAVSATHAWISSGGGPFVPQVKRTTDGGATWVEEDTDSNTGDVFSTVFFITPDYGWLGGTTSEPRGGILRRVPGVNTPTPTRTVDTTPTNSPTLIPTIPPTNTPSALCTPAPQSVTGSITFGDPITTEAIDWDRVQSTCEFPKTCPAPVTELTIHYDSYTYTNTTGISRCITVVLDGTTCGFDIEGVFSRAYLHSFDPNSACTNYLADAGFYSDYYAGEATYSFNIDAGDTFVVVVESISEEAGCNSYTLTVSGLNACTTATPVPVLTNTPTLTATNTPGTPVATETVGATNTAVASATLTTQVTSTATSVTSTPTACALSFMDVPPDHTFYSNIHCLACKGIVTGYPCGGAGEPCVPPSNNAYFRPGNVVTRGQLAKIVATSAGFQEPVGGQTFEDLLPGSTFYEFVERLAARDVMKGYPCGGAGEPCGTGELPYFRPNGTATRGQIAKIVANAAGLNQPAGAQQYEDVPEGSTFYEFIWRLTDLAVMGGYSCGGAGEPCGDPALPYFRPGANTTRGQVSKIVANTFFPDCQTAGGTNK